MDWEIGVARSLFSLSQLFFTRIAEKYFRDYWFEKIHLFTRCSQLRCFGTKFLVLLFELWSVWQLDVYEAMGSSAMCADVDEALHHCIGEHPIQVSLFHRQFNLFTFYWTNRNEQKNPELSVRRKNDHPFTRNTKPCFEAGFPFGFFGEVHGRYLGLKCPCFTDASPRRPTRWYVSFIARALSQWNRNQNQLERYRLSGEWQIALPSDQHWSTVRKDMSMRGPCKAVWASSASMLLNANVFFVCEGESFLCDDYFYSNNG